MNHEGAPPLQDTPAPADAGADLHVGAPPLVDTPHAGMSHMTPAQSDQPGASAGARFVGGIESGLLEANKLAAQFGLWLGHPQAMEDLAEAVRLQREHEAEVAKMAPTGTHGADIAHMAGEMAPAAVAGGLLGRMVEGTGWGVNALRGAVSGGGGSAVTPTEGTDNLREKGKQILSGAAGGALTSGIIPEMSPEAKMLVKEGVRLTPGMKARLFRYPEEAARSLPITGQAIGAAERAARDDFNRAIYNRVLAPIGQKYDPKLPVGTEGINRLRGQLSSAYDKALANTTFIANPPGVVPYGLSQGDLSSLNNILATMTRERRAQFDSIVRQYYGQRVPANRLMDGETFKRIESELGNQARNFSRAPDPDQRSVGQALDEVVSLMRDAHMVQNPNKAAELQAINRAYSLYVVAERGASGRSLSNGVMTPGDFLGALRAMDSSVRKNRFARGVLEMQDLAQAGNTVMTPHLGSSGTAERSFLIDLGLVGLGGEGARFAGVSSERMGEVIAGLAAASVPYLRLPAGWPTANLGSVVGQTIAPAVEGAAPLVGSAMGQAVTPSPLTGATNGMQP